MADEYLEDRPAIHDLFTRYCCALDNGEVETVVACFTADAHLKSPVIDLAGMRRNPRIRRAFRGAARCRHAVPPHGHQHRRHNRRRAGTATGVPAGADPQDGSHRTLPPGRYECDLVNRSGALAFTRRTVFHDHDYTLEGIGSR